MELPYVILIVLFIFYIPVYAYVRMGKLEKYGLVKYGPAIMVKTGLGKKTMERLARHRKVWDIFGTVSKIITIFLMAFIVFIVVMDIILLPRMLDSPNVGLEYVLAIPGLNPMLPLIYGIIGLIVAMVIHELAHGIQSRANDIDVDSSGLLYAVVPMGAFVEPNNDQLNASGRKARMNIFSAGIAANTVTAFAVFTIMALCMTSIAAPEYGSNPAVTGITSDSPAYEKGIPASAIILDFDGDTDLDFDPTRSISITYLTETERAAEDIYIGVYVAAVTPGSPAANNGNMLGKHIYSMENVTVPSEDPDRRITQINNLDTFQDFMNKTKSGHEIEVVLADPKTGETYPISVELASKGGIGFLGVSTNYSGMMFTTPNTVLSAAMNPFYGVGSATDAGNAAIMYIASPFDGYSPIPESIQWWYGTSDAFWIFVQTLYWIFWLNLVLAVFNALPAIPFDGGFLFSGGIDWMAEKMKMNEERRERVVASVTSAVSWIMIGAFVLILTVMIV